MVFEGRRKKSYITYAKAKDLRTDFEGSSD